MIYLWILLGLYVAGACFWCGAYIALCMSKHERGLEPWQKATWGAVVLATVFWFVNPFVVWTYGWEQL